MQGLILDTVAAEIETTNVIPTRFVERAGTLGILDWFKKDRDASSETFLKRLTDKLYFIDPFNLLTKSGRSLTQVTTGVELISVPMYFRDAERIFPLLLGELDREGELEKGTRNAIHFHVGFPHSLGSLLSAVTFSAKFESLMYQLGTMGYTFRGDSNNAIYCRPHTAPPIVRCEDGNYRPVLSYEQLITSETVDEFWRAYGVSQREPKRYHPSRYFGVNLLSILLHGTLEFRHFNFTVNSQLFLANMRLCQSTAEMLTKVPLRRLEELPFAPVTKSNDDCQLLEVLFALLDEFSDTYPMQPKYKTLLRELLCTAPKFVLPEGEIKSHLWDKYVQEDFYYTGDDKPRRKVNARDLKDSGFLDSHQASVHNIQFSHVINR
jgi:hypothetical protein